MTEAQLATLTDRERATLEALMAMRNQYRAHGHHIAAHAMGVAIWLAWQVLARTPEKGGNTP